jgi:hypothetical protein
VKRTLFFILTLVSTILNSQAALPASAQAQTGRDYYNELKATNGETNALNHYSDEYVCFEDGTAPSFAIISKVSHVIQAMKQTGATVEAKKLEQSQFKDDLFVQGYYKGIAAKQQVYEAAGTDYSIEFGAPFHGKMTYPINWATGRYCLRVYALDKSKTVPATEAFGKCELIHPAK